MHTTHLSHNSTSTTHNTSNMVPTTVYCRRASSYSLPGNLPSSFSMEHSAHSYRRSDSDSLQEDEDVSLEDLEQMKSIVKDIRLNPNLLSKVFPQVFPTTIQSTTLDERDERGSVHSHGSLERREEKDKWLERREEKDKWFISIDVINCS